MCSANSRSKQRVYVKLLTQRDAVQRRSVNRQEKNSLIVAPRAYNQPQPRVVDCCNHNDLYLTAAFNKFSCGLRCTANVRVYIGEKPNRKLRVGTFTQGMSVA